MNIQKINEIIPLKTINEEIKNKNLIYNNSNIFILNYISLVKTISTVFVVMMHTNENYYVFNKYWPSTNIITGFIYCAVPLFCLCIGATLLDYNERYSIKEYFKRRFKKVIIPLIGWNVIIYFYRIYILKDFKKRKLSFEYLYHLYFKSLLYPIANLYYIFIWWLYYSKL